MRGSLRRLPRWTRALIAVSGTLLAAAGAFRLWVRLGGRDGEAPRIGMVVGDDWMNRIGVHDAAYEAVITHAGGRVVRLEKDDARTPDAILDSVDAIVLTGGGDVDPALSGANAERAQLVDRARDDFELALVRRALERDVPVLGVCRGIQLVNVARGGTLRDLRADETLFRTHGITLRSLDAHEVQITEGSALDALTSADALDVNSFHGQAVDRVGEGLRVAAVSPDGVVEAVEVPGARFALFVQWHPEVLYWSDETSRRIIRRLVAEARARRD